MALLPLLRLELLRQRRQPMVLLSLTAMGLLGAPFAASQAFEQGDGIDFETALSGESLRTAPRIQADATFASWVVVDDGLSLAAGPLDDDGELVGDEVIAHVTVDGDERVVRVETGLRSARVSDTIDRIRSVRDRHDASARQDEATRIGLDLAVIEPEVRVESHERSDTQVSPWVLYGLPWLMTMLATTGALYGAFDVLLSERLHSTAETLLTSAATRRAIALAKAGIVALLGLGFAAASMVGLVVGFAAGAYPALDPAPGPVVALGAVAVAAVLSVQLAAGFLGIATYCEDHKTAGLVAGPMLLGPPILASLAAFPGPSLSVWSACLPVTNVLLVWRDALLGTLTVPGALGVAVAVTVQTALAWRFTARRLSDPDIVTGVATAEGRRGLGRFGPDALVTYAVALASFWFIGIILQQLHLELGLVASQLAFVAIGLGGAAFFGMDRRRLRLALPRGPADLVIGIGIGLCTPLLAGAVFWAQEAVFPGGQAFAEQFGDTLGVDRPLWVQLLLFAALPGLCEELLFRSALLGMLDRDAKPAARIVLVAVLFALLHLSIYRLIPTFLLGVIMGWITLRARSVWPSVAMHMTHNGASFTMGALATTGAEELSHVAAGGLLVVSALGLLGLGMALERRSVT